MASESATSLSLRKRPPWRAMGAIVAMLCVFFVLAWTAAGSKSATCDEPLHGVSAFVEWRYGDYRVNPEDPPLFKYWAMLPMPSDALDVKRDIWVWNDMAYDLSATRWAWAIDMLYRRGIDGDEFISRARLMMLLLGTAAGGVMAWWTYRLAGAIAAIIAAALFAADPNFLGHAPLVKNDVAMTLVMISLSLAIWFAGRRATVWNLSSIALLVGAGLLTKFSGVLLAPILFVLLLIRALMPLPWVVLGRTLKRRGQRVTAALSTCLFTGVVSFVMIWMAYGFRFSPTPEGITYDQQYLLDRAHIKTLIAELGREPTPQELSASQPPMIGRIIQSANKLAMLPQAWLNGFLFTYDSSILRDAFLLGERRATGWWYYFPLAMLFKTPLATLAAMIIAIVIAIFAVRRNRNTLREHGWTIACLAAPMIVYGYTALTTNLNLGLRHVLPIYPFLFIATAIALVTLWRKGAGKVVVVAVLLGIAIESLAAFPNYIAFFNTAAGGSRGGFRLLSDSNLDWGQDLKLIAEWQQNNPTRPLYLAYFGTVDPDFYGMQFTHLPGGYPFGEKPEPPTAPGVIAASATLLQGIYGGGGEHAPFYQALRQREPFEVLGGTIYLYEWPLR